MIFKMNLHNTPFLKIKSGEKTIELRLNDDKRKEIKIGDYIIFTNTINKERLIVRVINLHRYNNFDELYQNLPLERCGYDKESIKDAKASDMRSYYSYEEEQKYGVLGIEISKCKFDVY